ncbi:hypothetical protein [Salinibacterium sp. PAMC 21357]|uniref:hypothetical protein n=1 Tax=Salinibacterium sp. PAMC 21357 TaxID=1112215 RepID=UPI0002884CDB|nr:hypothetical protein [Salinibacterium sp. PAMC 21357]
MEVRDEGGSYSGSTYTNSGSSGTQITYSWKIWDGNGGNADGLYKVWEKFDGSDGPHVSIQDLPKC